MRNCCILFISLCSLINAYNPIEECIQLNCGYITEKCEKNLVCSQYADYCVQGCQNSAQCQIMCMSQYEDEMMQEYSACGQAFSCFTQESEICTQSCIVNIQGLIKTSPYFHNMVNILNQLQAEGQDTMQENCASTECICYSAKLIKTNIEGCKNN